MEFLLANPQIHSTFASLGTMQGDTYVVNEDCLSILEEINCKLSCEDHTLRTFRRAIGFGQNVQKDLIPLLINVKDDKILDAAIRLLVNLTVPIECLLSVEVMSRTEIGRHTIYELNRLLLTSKEVFVDNKSTKAIIDHMKSILEKEHRLSMDQCDSINNCLLLLRNILHIPEPNRAVKNETNEKHQGQGFAHNQSHSATSMQNQILWNLFTQSIDKLIVHLMSCPQKSHFVVTMVQLIALMYKDQHVGTLQKLLNLWLEVTTLSDSSEDNESNTSPPKQCSGDSSPMLTSDPTSDSSDNGCGKMINCSNEQDGDNVPRMTNSDFQNSIIRVKPLQLMSYNSNKSVDGDNQFDTKGSVTNLSDIVMKSLPQSPEHEASTSSKEAEKQEIDSSNSDINDSSCSNNNNNKNNTNISSRNKQNNNNKNRSPNTNSNNQNQASAKKMQTKSDGKNHYSGTSLSDQLSDCGYGTQVSQENQESISTSSNDDESPKQKPVHQKPPSTNQKQRYNAAQKQRNAVQSAQDKKELRRKKLVKRSKSSIINMKGILHHTPTDDDISNILKEFTVDFLLKAYGFLVHELHAQLLSETYLYIDTSHFFWLVTYFLKFAAQLELELEHISSVLSFDVISYLTYEGASLCEQLELASRQQGTDLKPLLRRIHLVVTAIREFLQAIEVYKRSSHLSSEDKQLLSRLQFQISSAEDLRCLFILLLRCYNPNLQSRQYLQDIVVTNHILLMMIDNSPTRTDTKGSMKMLKHIKQFATVDIMYQYGLLLENFSENGEYVNDCIFTMMHHIGGDLDQVHILFQPSILKTYSRIWETEYELCDDWTDLIEYVIHKFINAPAQPPIALPSPAQSGPNENINISDVWAQEEMDILYWYYVQSKTMKDMVGNIIKQIQESGHASKSRIAVIQQLLQQDVISLEEFDELMKFENSQYEREDKKSSNSTTSSAPESGVECVETQSVSSSNKSVDDIKVLRDLLIKENNTKMISWLQNVLLECCFVKLNLIQLSYGGSLENTQTLTTVTTPVPAIGTTSSTDTATNSSTTSTSTTTSVTPSNNNSSDQSKKIMEPVPYHCILKKQSIPLIPYNSDQNKILVHQPFVLLLHKLGFHLPADANKLFVRIPEFWTADMLYSVAEKLGPIPKHILKFDMNQIIRAPSTPRSDYSLFTMDEQLNNFPAISPKDDTIYVAHRSKMSNSIIRYTPDPTPSQCNSNWMQLVMRSKSAISENALPTMILKSSVSELPISSAVAQVATSVIPKPLSPKSPHGKELDMIMEVENDGEDMTNMMKIKSVSSILVEHDAGSVCTDASDLTRMYVSDEEDKIPLLQI